MKLRLAGVFADAAALWRANHDVLTRVAAVFFFLPMLASELFLTAPDPGEATPEQALGMLRDWYVQNWAWFVASSLIESFGICVLLVLVLDPAKPTPGEALARALRLLPALIVASLTAGILVVLGFIALIVPGLYLSGRTMLTGAIVVAEPGRNPFASVAESIARTRGNGWTLLLATMGVTLAVSIAGSALSDIKGALAAVPAAGALASLMIAALVAAGGLLQVLVQAAAYRALTARQGI